MTIATPNKLRIGSKLLATVVFLTALGMIFSTSGSEPSWGEPSALAAPEMSNAEKPKFISGDELEQPKGYREWVYIGTPLTPNDMNGGKAAFPEFHSVYIHPEDFARYKRIGEFPDGTIIVKELVGVGTKQATSGKGYFMGEFTGLEAAVKDSKRFPKEPGGWAYYSFGHEYPLAKTSKPQPTTSCNTCHGGSAAQDYVFTQYYPVLRAANPKTGMQKGSGMR